MAVWVARHPSLRTSLAALAVLAALLCAGGAGDAAMALADDNPRMDCDASGRSAQEHCRAASPEMPSLAVGPSVVGVAHPHENTMTPGLFVPVSTSDRQATPLVPRSPPRV